MGSGHPCGQSGREDAWVSSPGDPVSMACPRSTPLLSQVTTLTGGPLGITPQGNITAFSADLVGQFGTVPEPSSLMLAGLGLGAVVTAALVVAPRPGPEPSRPETSRGLEGAA